MNTTLHPFYLLCLSLDIGSEEIRSSSRKREIREKRQIICYILRVKMGLLFKEIAKIVNRDHSTVMHSVQTVENEIKWNETLEQRIFHAWACSFANGRADRSVEPMRNSITE